MYFLILRNIVYLLQNGSYFKQTFFRFVLKFLYIAIFRLAVRYTPWVCMGVFGWLPVNSQEKAIKVWEGRLQVYTCDISRIFLDLKSEASLQYLAFLSAIAHFATALYYTYVRLSREATVIRFHDRNFN